MDNEKFVELNNSGIAHLSNILFLKEKNTDSLNEICENLSRPLFILLSLRISDTISETIRKGDSL